jgi:hypothetical protein
MGTVRAGVLDLILSVLQRFQTFSGTFFLALGQELSRAELAN